MHRIDIFFPFVLPRVKDIGCRSYLLCPANASACFPLATSFGGIEVAVGLMRRGEQERARGRKTMIVPWTVEPSVSRRENGKFWKLTPKLAPVIRSVFPVLVLILMLGFLACPGVFAQTAQVSGSVTDASGAA